MILGLLLSNNQFKEILDPTWDQVKAAIANISPNHSVLLGKSDGQAIRADGASRKFTILFYDKVEEWPYIVGRRQSEPIRGHTTTQRNKVLVTPWEYWSQTDGQQVFQTFYDGEPLPDTYTLRDQRVEYSDKEIRKLITSAS